MKIEDYFEQLDSDIIKKEKIRIYNDSLKKMKSFKSIKIDFTDEEYSKIKEESDKLNCTPKEIVELSIIEEVKKTFNNENKDYKCIDIAEMLLFLESDEELEEEYLVYNQYNPKKPFILMPHK